MKSMNRWMPAIVAGTMLIAACDQAPTDAPLVSTPATNVSAAAGERIVEESLFDFDGVYFSFACSAEGEPLDSHEGELVRMYGKVYEKYTSRRDAMGGYHITLQRMPVGLGGVGETSGEEFRATERQHATYNQMLVGATGNWRAELKLTGKDTRRVYWLVTRGNYRVTSEGDLEVQRETQTVECRP